MGGLKKGVGEDVGSTFGYRSRSFCELKIVLHKKKQRTVLVNKKSLGQEPDKN